MRNPNNANKIKCKSMIPIFVLMSLYGVAAYALFRTWTASKMTYFQGKVIISVELLLIGLMIMAYKLRFSPGLKKTIAVLILSLFVISNSVLSYHAFSIYSLSQLSNNIPRYSSYLPPNGDLSMLQEILEGKRITISNCNANVNELCRRISDNVVEEWSDIDAIENELSTHEFQDLGYLNGMYKVYAPVFGIESVDSENIPKLYIEPFECSSDTVVIVTEDSARNVYVYSK